MTAMLPASVLALPQLAAEIPMRYIVPGGDAVKPNVQAPWVLIGGSYSGALTAYTMVKLVYELMRVHKV